MPRKKTKKVENPPEAQEEPECDESQNVLCPYKPPDWCTKEEVGRFKADIALMKKSSDIVSAIEHGAFGRELKKSDIKPFVLKTLFALFSDVKQRFVPPAFFFEFNSRSDEVALNINFSQKISLQSYQDYRRKYKHFIPKECSVFMLENNPVFDWSYMGIKKAIKQHVWRVNKKKEGLSDVDFMKFGFDNVEKKVKSRNDVAKFAKQLEIQNKGKFILIDDISYEFLFHKSNYFDIMFPFLSSDRRGDEHNERVLMQYFENIFKTQPSPDLPHRDKFMEVRKQLEMNDGWITATDLQELEQKVSKHYFSYRIH